MKTPKRNQKVSRLHTLFSRNNPGRFPDLQKTNSSREAIQDWLVFKLSELLEIDPDDIDIHQPFARYGLGSAEAVGLAGDLENWLKRRLSATLAWDYPNIEVLARHLAEEATTEDSDSMIHEDGEDEEYEVR